jgi:putative ABC transport system permease protein
MKVERRFFDTMDMKLSRAAASRRRRRRRAPAGAVNRRFAEAPFPGRSALGQRLADGGSGKQGPHRSRDRRRVRRPSATRASSWRRRTSCSPAIAARGQGADAHAAAAGEARHPRELRAELLRQLKGVRNDWSYRISPIATCASPCCAPALPLVVLSVIAAFLLVMVAFGLFGVLWQNTTRRIPEIGLRRATGATAADIYRQIIIEQLLLTSLAMAVGLLLLVQLPITGVLGQNLDWKLFLGAAAVAITVMALVSVLCALYPAWRASRLSPTQALHYE